MRERMIEENFFHSVLMHAQVHENEGERELGENWEDKNIFFRPLPLMNTHTHTRERGRERGEWKNFLSSSPHYVRT